MSGYKLTLAALLVALFVYWYSPARKKAVSVMNRNKAPFREYAGVLVAFIVVISFTAVGFMTMTAQLLFDKTIDPPGEWLAAMLSLASAGLGYLIGKQAGTDKQN